MKIERLLLGLFASFLMVGCSQNDDLPNGGEESNVKDSYVTVKIKSTASASRAAENGGFLNGTENENEVKSAHFFFFKKDGGIFNISAPDDTNFEGTAVGNWLYFASFADGTEQSGNGNIEEVLDATLVFKGEEGDEIPGSIVAVLNMDNANLANFSSGITMEDLQKIMILEDKAYSESNSTVTNFVMSNSVYSDGTNAVLSQGLTAANVASDIAAAKQNAVTIHVERLAARVSVGVNETEVKSGTEDVFDTNTGINLDGATAETKVYAKILSWDINTTIDQSYLLKSIEPAWTNDGLGFVWNDKDNYRSYWAETTSITNAIYDTTFDFDNFNDLGEQDYCLENTGSTKTKVIVRAQLVDESNNPLEIAQWYAEYYKFDDLKGVIASALSGQLYYSTDNGATWKNIAAKADTEEKPQSLDYIALIAGDGDGTDETEDHYQVSFDLSDAGKGVLWAADANGSTTLSADDVAAKLKALLPAKVWTAGAAYYFTDIEHLGSDAIQNYGVVRNHAYEVVIDGVKGLGTPVYSEDPDDFPEIPEPDVPSQKDSYISAKINILSWKLISNGVVLGK